MITQSAPLDGEDVNRMVVDAGVWRDRCAAAVVPAVADPDLQQVVELNAVEVAPGNSSNALNGW
jgi:hypothetical protein